MRKYFTAGMRVSRSLLLTLAFPTPTYDCPPAAARPLNLEASSAVHPGPGGMFRAARIVAAVVACASVGERDT